MFLPALALYTVSVHSFESAVSVPITKVNTAAMLVLLVTV